MIKERNNILEIWEKEFTNVEDTKTVYLPHASLKMIKLIIFLFEVIKIHKKHNSLNDESYSAHGLRTS